MEGSVQGAEGRTIDSAAGGLSGAAEVAFEPDDVERDREELRMLIIGFCTGLSVGLAFLVYVVLAEAKLFT